MTERGAAAAMPPTSERPRRSFAPREHGAYGQLGFPLLAALAATTPTVAATLYALAAILLLLAHEPALVLLERRGARARRDHARAATVRLTAAIAGAAAAAAGAIALAPATASATAVPAALAGLVAALIAADVEKTTAGETLAACAMASAALPVARAGGAAWTPALAAWAAWALGFAAVVAPVRAVIARAKLLPRPPALPVAVVTTIAIAALGAGWRREVLSGLALAAAGWLLALTPPSPRALRRIGWALVGASATTAALLIASARR